TGKGESQMYAHALATIALCESFGLGGDEDLRTPATRALGFIVAAQDPKTGGRRSRPRGGGDPGFAGGQLMPLTTGERRGLPAPPATYRDAARWLDAVRV